MSPSRIKIRAAKVDDALELMQMVGHSMMELCCEDYTQEQLEGWVKSHRLEKYQKRLKIHRSFVAEMDGNIVGYVRWNPGTNELCSIFVDPDYARQGIGTKLMQVAYEDVLSAGVTELWLDATLTAVPFYEAEGWKYIEQRKHGLLECVRMTKELDPGKKNTR